MNKEDERKDERPTFLTLLPNSCAAVPVLKSSFEFCSGPADSKESQVFVGEDLEFHKRRLGLERMLRVHQRLRDPHSVLAADRPQPTARVDVPECGNPIVPCFSASDCVVSRVDISRASVSPMVSASPSVCSSLSLASAASAASAAAPSASFVAGVGVAAVSGGCDVVALGGVEGGSTRRRSRFSLSGSSHARDMDSGIALGNANSCADTGNLLRVQRDNSCRKVRLKSSVGDRSVVQTVDMSPAPGAGTYRRSADEVHDQRQISRKRQAVCSGGDPDPGPGPGPGGRCGLVRGSLDCAAAWIPCSLVMPPGRHQRAPQSLGWEWVCGTEKSGVWVLKGDARTYNLPRDLDDVGIVWEHRSGYETAWATPGHVCSCSYGYGHGPVLPQPNPSVFTEVIKLWSRVASLLTPWCAKGEVPTGVNLNRYSGNGSRIPWHCDNERLFGLPSEPKVIVSMSLGHSVLFKLCRRASEKTVTPIWLDHGDLLVMDGLTQEEFLHSTASELEGPRVNLTYRWISQHIRSCPQAGLICGALPSEAQDLAEPNSCREGVEEIKMTMTCLMVLLVVLGTCFLRKYVFDAYEGVRCRNYHCWASLQWRIPRRNHLMENWLFHFLGNFHGGKSKDFCHFLAFFYC